MSAAACLFVGPSLRPDEVRAAAGPDIVLLPPAAQGDVYRVAAGLRPRAIGIVDGYFEGVPAVWHKEVLWAMAEGIHVLGGASMGALRAAELHPFGMTGVGAIFESYRDGACEDDDEVAVLHGPPETGYVALSEAMVNVRATLARAEAEGVVAPDTRRALERLAKEIHYRDRSWPALLDGPAPGALPAAEREALRAWLPRGRVDVKRADALAVIAATRALLAGDAEPMGVAYHFEWTEMWDDLVGLVGVPGEAPEGDGAGWLPRERLLDELRLDAGDAVRRAEGAALLRLLALREADRRRLGADRGAVTDTLNRFRAERELFSRAALDRWLARNDLDATGFERLVEEEARIAALGRWAGPALGPHLLASLRASGDYPRLAGRARRKQRVLASLGLDDPDPHDAGPTPAGLVLWYFERRLGRPVPDDIEAYARCLGFAGLAEFHRALAREHLYLRATEDGSEA